MHDTTRSNPSRSSISRSDPSVPQVFISAKTRLALQEHLGDLEVDPYADPVEFRAEVKRRLVGVAPELDALSGLLRCPRTAAVRMRNLPIGQLGDTPTMAGAIPNKTDHTSEAILFALALSAAAHVFTFVDEAGGRPVHQVAPDPQFSGRATGTGSGVDFAWHIEAAARVLRPDAIALLCLRGAEDAATTIAPVYEALGLLSRRQVQALRQRYYVIQVPESFGAGGWSEPVPVISGSPNAPRARVNFVGTIPTVDAPPIAREALDAFREALDEVARFIVLRPGEALLIDNRAATHGRTRFVVEAFGGEARWLQRVYLALSPRVGTGVVTF